MTDTSERKLSPTEFRDVIGHFASGVTIITTQADGEPLGTTASAVSSLSLEPPMLLICMNKTSATGQAITAQGRFAVNILSQEQARLAERFARKNPDKFTGVDYTPSASGMPFLAAAVANLDCRVTEETTGGTHSVFLAEVAAAVAHGGRSPLAYFRGRFGRLELAPDDDGAVTWPVIEDAITSCAAIELGVAELLGGRLDDEQLAELRAAHAALARQSGQGTHIDPEVAIGANARFHQAIVGFAGSPELLAAYQRLAVPSLAARLFGPHTGDELHARLAEDHREIVEGFAAGDHQRVRAAMLRHRDGNRAVFRRAVEAADGAR